MSKVSIYENSWINLVFEGKNKEYGAYQLRQESDKTTMLAFFMGLLLVFMAASTPLIMKVFGTDTVVTNPVPGVIDRIIEVTTITPPKPEKPVKAILPMVKKTDKEVTKKEDLINPVIAKPVDANQDIARNDEITTPQNDNPNGTVTGSTTPSTGEPLGKAITAATDSGTTINRTTALDKLPEFPGGIKKFYTYVGNNFEKPEIEMSKTLTVLVYFVIEKDGSITDIKVQRDPGYGLGNEAIRVLKSLKTKWAPGMIDGQPVRTAYNLPITVKLE